MTRYYFITIFCLFVLVGCNDSTNNHDNALPHSNTAANNKISTTDKAKLTNAKGKKVQEVDIYDIEQMFDASQGRLHVFSFWKYDCEDCKTSIKVLQEALTQIEDSKYRWILINMDDQSKAAAVNTYIRSENIFGETYIFSPKTKNWMDGLHESWNGQIPATFFVLEDEEIKMYLARKLEKNELEAVLNALVF